MMRRYIGRARGQHRGKKSWAFKPTPLFWLSVAAAAMILAAIVVWIVNPGSNIPGDERGSRPTSGVTPIGSPSDSGHKRHHH